MTHTFALPQAVVKQLEKVSVLSKQSPAAIVKQAVQDRLHYEEWKTQKIQNGLADIQAGRVHGKEAFWIQLEKARNARKKAA